MISFSFTSGIPVTGNLTILYTLIPAKQTPTTGSLFDRPAIEHTERFVSLSKLKYLILLTDVKLTNGFYNQNSSMVTMNSNVR